MTDTNRLAQRTRAATDNLARIAKELAAAQEDVALLDRLKNAQATVKRLTGEQEAASAEIEAAQADERAARQDARFATLSNINVMDKRPEVNLLGATFVITYTRQAWNFELGRIEPKLETVNGFIALPSDAFDFLIERHPERIPERIANLSPGDPREAFRRYFRGLRNGYMRG